MRTSISNLNGEQQNKLNHLSRDLKRALNPLAIICYGHRAGVSFQSSAFLNSGVRKSNSSVFDIFLMINNDETLPDSVVLEIARRSCAAHTAGNIIVFRMQDVLLNLKNESRFFSSIFRNGILLHGNKNALRLLPAPLPPVCFTSDYEKQALHTLLQYSQQCLLRVEKNLKDGYDDPQLNLILLNESAVFSIRYFIAAYWGTEIQAGLNDLLKFSTNITDDLNGLFPCNTMEELIMFHVINLDLIDEGFCAGDALIRTLFKRVSRLVALSKSCAQRKIAQLLPA
ncbi:hypothetical protein [Pedobacter hartonius]|uniref:Uncharacterized protein n=1 Tax=Pedobacter hartonius TaxID=425514 RepID=A0A1H4E9F5_9SPHI|nr:hypothetical protein [Pedobacter hartonius]SEA81673.1 hypothetical protein SAMN05443550_105307 [Pedobacter hartonius]